MGGNVAAIAPQHRRLYASRSQFEEKKGIAPKPVKHGVGILLVAFPGQIARFQKTMVYVIRPPEHPLRFR